MVFVNLYLYSQFFFVYIFIQIQTLKEAIVSIADSQLYVIKYGLFLCTRHCILFSLYLLVCHFLVFFLVFILAEVFKNETCLENIYCFRLMFQLSTLVHLCALECNLFYFCFAITSLTQNMCQDLNLISKRLNNFHVLINSSVLLLYFCNMERRKQPFTKMLKINRHV